MKMYSITGWELSVLGAIIVVFAGIGLTMTILWGQVSTQAKGATAECHAIYKAEVHTLHLMVEAQAKTMDSLNILLTGKRTVIE